MPSQKWQKKIGGRERPRISREDCRAGYGYQAPSCNDLMQGSGVEVAGDEVALLNLKQRRLLRRTPRMGVGATSVEPAPRGRVDGARYLSTDHISPLLARVH